MKKIEIFEQVINSEKPVDLRKVGINSTMYWAYRTSKKVGNDLIDFHEVIWDDDIAAIADICDEAEVTEFTISNNASGLIKTLAEFEKYGFVMDGLTEVKGGYTDSRTKEYAVIPAIKMTRRA